MLVPFALMRGMVGLRVVLLLCLGVFFLRFTPSLGAAGVANPDASQISVLTWNVFAEMAVIRWFSPFKLLVLLCVWLSVNVRARPSPDVTKPLQYPLPVFYLGYNAFYIAV